MSRDAIEVLAFAAAKRFRARLPCRAFANERASGYGTVTLGEHPMLQRLWIQGSDLHLGGNLTSVERDIQRLAEETDNPRSGVAMPVSLWRLNGADRWIQVTTRLWVLDELRRIGSDRDSDGAAIVTLSLDAFIDVLRSAIGGAP